MVVNDGMDSIFRKGDHYFENYGGGIVEYY
jgi:hypothetical protein